MRGPLLGLQIEIRKRIFCAAAWPLSLSVGLFGGPENNRALSDEDGDGVWSITMRVPIGLSGTYLYLNNPSSDTDMGTRENLMLLR